MLMVVSPAKSLDETSQVPTSVQTECAFLNQAQTLINQLQSLEPNAIGDLMSISDKLSQLNYQRFQDWQLPFGDSAKQAAWLFKGDVYTGLDAYSLNDEQVNYLQNHFRILSGLYGLLKPCDLILPYRLEMGTKFANEKGKNLYEFWGDQITELLNQQFAESGSATLVNLASNEYFKAVKPKNLKGQVITPIFKDWKNGQYKIISFYAKKARGLMARYAADNLLEEVEGLKYFDYDGYQFAPELSSEKDWVFTRKLED
ncbi:peroxide stress protein YaaA [Thiomicrorhabdus indica]|uniref:peroxide stress protein YaaA n=1 Tax=Thiomicrorhabdus indica TaxID=2267253 RepID=UPI00102D68F0|nr:peroxide stress protein YaaA [Thiomicrorhabdus indica]